MNKYKTLTISCLCILLMACGGGSASSPSIGPPIVPPIGPEEPPVGPEEPPVVLPLPEQFNFISISALRLADKPEELSFIWDGDPAGLSYDICIFDPEKADDCNVIKTVTGVNQATAAVPLVQYIATDFFILAKNANGKTKSKPLAVEVEVINKLTQYIKAIIPKATDQFGNSVSISSDGKTMVIGTNSTEIGGVYIYNHDGNKWAFKEQKMASTENDAFGAALSLSGDGKTLAVAARLTNKVYFYSLENDTWTENRFVTASAGDDGFGYSLDLSFNGDTLVVGTFLDSSTSLLTTGAAYVFEKTKGVFSLKERLQGSKLQKGDEFGTSVSISGNGLEIAVGASKDDLDYQGTPGTINDDNGAVYLFSKTTGLWKEETYLKLQTSVKGDKFGLSVSLNHDGKVLAVGSPFRAGSGKVFIFNKNKKNNWEENLLVLAENLKNDDFFGYRLVLNSAGTRLAVNSYFDSSDGKGVNPIIESYTSVGSSGALRLFKLDSNSWKQIAYIKGPNSSKVHFFGSTMDLSNDGKLVIGSSGESSNASGINGNMLDNSSPASGAAFVY